MLNLLWGGGERITGNLKYNSRKFLIIQGRENSKTIERGGGL